MVSLLNAHPRRVLMATAQAPNDVQVLLQPDLAQPVAQQMDQQAAPPVQQVAQPVVQQAAPEEAPVQVEAQLAAGPAPPLQV